MAGDIRESTALRSDPGVPETQADAEPDDTPNDVASVGDEQGTRSEHAEPADREPSHRGGRTGRACRWPAPR